MRSIVFGRAYGWHLLISFCSIVIEMSRSSSNSGKTTCSPRQNHLFSAASWFKFQLSFRVSLSSAFRFQRL